MTQKTVSIEIPAPPEGYGDPVYGHASGPFAILLRGVWQEMPGRANVTAPCVFAPKLSAEQLEIAELKREIETLKQENRKLRGGYRPPTGSFELVKLPDTITTPSLLLKAKDNP